MREGWEVAPLGELTAQVKDSVKVVPGAEYVLLGVSSKGRGVFSKEAVTSVTSKAKAFTPVRRDQFIYNRLFAGTGSFGVVPAEMDGTFVSNEFPVFDVDPLRLDVRFLGLTFEQPSVWADVEAQCIGSTGSRMRWKEDRFNEYRVPLPPLAEQRRIVDLIGAVDEALVSADEEARRAGNATQSAEVAHFSGGGETHLTEVTHFAGGYAFSDRFQGGTGPIPVYKCSDMNAPGNETEMSTAANSVTEETLKEMKARAWPPGTVIFPKVGAALLTEKRRILGSRAAFDNNVMGLVPDPSIRPEYLLSFMRTVRLGDYAQPGAVPSVNQKHFQQMTLNLPSLEDQDEFLGLIGALTQVEVSASEVTGCLREARSALLAELLSGDFEIPDSYDSLLKVTS